MGLAALRLVDELLRGVLLRPLLATRILAVQSLRDLQVFEHSRHASPQRPHIGYVRYFIRLVEDCRSFSYWDRLDATIKSLFEKVADE